MWSLGLALQPLLGATADRNDTIVADFYFNEERPRVSIVHFEMEHRIRIKDDERVEMQKGYSHLTRSVMEPAPQYSITSCTSWKAVSKVYLIAESDN